MSAWRLAVRGLHELGGSATSGDVQRSVAAEFDACRGLQDAARLRLVVSPGKVGKRGGVWRISNLGIDWCDGFVTTVQQPRTPGQKGEREYLVATWLRALPRGVRLGGNS